MAQSKNYLLSEIPLWIRNFWIKKKFLKLTYICLYDANELRDKSISIRNWIFKFLMHKRVHFFCICIQNDNKCNTEFCFMKFKHCNITYEIFWFNELLIVLHYCFLFKVKLLFFSFCLLLLVHWHNLTFASYNIQIARNHTITAI